MVVSLPDQLAYEAYIIQAAALASAAHFYSRDRRKRVATRRGKSARRRIRRSVEEIFDCLGPIYFRRAYRMSYESFWRLHSLLLAFSCSYFHFIRFVLRLKKKAFQEIKS